MRFIPHERHRDMVDRIICSPQQMVQCIGYIIDEDPMPRFGYLIHEPTMYGPGPQSVYMFRSGAKLYFDPKQPSEWWLSGHGAGSEARAAVLALRAADHIRQAVNLMHGVDLVLHRPRSQCVTYRGLWGTWNNGQRYPSALNNEPKVKD